MAKNITLTVKLGDSYIIFTTERGQKYITSGKISLRVETAHGAASTAMINNEVFGNPRILIYITLNFFNVSVGDKKLEFSNNSSIGDGYAISDISLVPSPPGTFC
jgi:hypothetical protein